MISEHRRAPAGVPASSPRSRMHVLIVDDQSHVRTWVHRLLNRAGIVNVVEAFDGRDALAAVTKQGAWFDLILCDLRMPDRDGIETIRSFAALGLESAIAVMSMESQRVIDTAGLLGELQGLRVMTAIQKPLTMEKLEALLEEILTVPGARPALPEAVPPSDFPDAFARSELVMHYQPKIRLRDGTFAGVEALVRWKHPVLGLISPDLFVPEMQASEGQCDLLTDFTLGESIACAGRWVAMGKDLRVAINLPAQAFDRLSLPERLENLARESHVPTDRITLEVTETQVARNAIRMLDVATRLRLKGFSLSIDDFGTGHSGLSMLQRMPFNELKIDRSFVHGCATVPTNRSVVETSIALARNLKMTSVAEGIQQRPDWDVLVDLGCEVMQGYFIARPMSEEGLEVWAAKWSIK
jgi:EAL domain-containing protein (putative c-di-GMP-specific phosphodiesterase class I)/CheY-like chemotaxis protein